MLGACTRRDPASNRAKTIAAARLPSALLSVCGAAACSDAAVCRCVCLSAVYFEVYVFGVCAHVLQYVNVTRMPSYSRVIYLNTYIFQIPNPHYSRGFFIQDTTHGTRNKELFFSHTRPDCTHTTPLPGQSQNERRGVQFARD